MTRLPAADLEPARRVLSVLAPDPDAAAHRARLIMAFNYAAPRIRVGHRGPLPEPIGLVAPIKKRKDVRS